VSLCDLSARVGSDPFWCKPQVEILPYKLDEIFGLRHLANGWLMQCRKRCWCRLKLPEVKKVYPQQHGNFVALHPKDLLRPP